MPSEERRLVRKSRGLDIADAEFQRIPLDAIDAHGRQRTGSMPFVDVSEGSYLAGPQSCGAN